MTKPTNVVAGAGCALAAVLVFTIVLPLFAMVALTGPGGVADPTSGLRTDGIPPAVASAYQRAAAAARGFAPPCHIPAWILAGVGKVETNHGAFGGGSIAGNGSVSPRIVGPALPSLGPDTDDGRWDEDTRFDHAVGPMQFIPATWRSYGRDGNGDRLVDPHNIFDAALGAAAYLCASGGPMATEADWHRGLLAYNHSEAYVAKALATAYAYRAEASRPAPQRPGEGPIQLVDVAGIGPTNVEWAAQVGAMLAAAAHDGIHLTGSSYRDPAEQIALRRAHCGTSHYATYDMPSSSCRPPTARPGTSQHEVGLAIDFRHCSIRSTACYRWLAANAARFGIHNLPSEPWHWSATGR